MTCSLCTLRCLSIDFLAANRKSNPGRHRTKYENLQEAVGGPDQGKLIVRDEEVPQIQGKEYKQPSLQLTDKLKQAVLTQSQELFSRTPPDPEEIIG